MLSITSKNLQARWGVWVFGLAFVTLAVSIPLIVGPTAGWLSSMAILTGATAYMMMATNLFLAIRRPVLERIFGPLDRVYNAHRVIGTGILAVLGVHLVLMPLASAVDRGRSILDNLTVTVPLGILGTILLVGSIALAVNTKVPYNRWLRLHLATALAFLVLTLHMVSGSGVWFSLVSPYGGLLGAFAVLGVGSIAMRLVDKARGGVRYSVAGTQTRERSLEVFMEPEGAHRIAPHRPGQFVFLTASVGGIREAHPFTLTSLGGESQISVLLRPSGDWTAHAQSALARGDQVRIDGPFGQFTPPIVDSEESANQVWIAGGAGITPFLSVLRTASQAWREGVPGPGSSFAGNRGKSSWPTDVELVIAASDRSDVPCWDELQEIGEQLPWLRLTLAFSALGSRLDQSAVDLLVSGKPEGTEWYLCGPSGLTSMVARTLDRARVPSRLVHREHYEWRATRSVPLKTR